MKKLSKSAKVQSTIQDLKNGAPGREDGWEAFNRLLERAVHTKVPKNK